MSVLGNFVKLVPNEPKRLRLKNPRIEERIIHDPKTGRVKRVRAWVADCYEEDGIPVSKTFSTLSEKLASTLQALHDAGMLEDRLIEIVWRPMDYATEYEVRVLE